MIVNTSEELQKLYSYFHKKTKNISYDEYEVQDILNDYLKHEKTMPDEKVVKLLVASIDDNFHEFKSDFDETEHIYRLSDFKCFVSMLSNHITGYKVVASSLDYNEPLLSGAKVGHNKTSLNFEKSSNAQMFY